MSYHFYEVLDAVSVHGEMSCRDRRALCASNKAIRDFGLCATRAHELQCGKEEAIKKKIIASFSNGQFGDMLEALGEATPTIGMDWDANRDKTGHRLIPTAAVENTFEGHTFLTGVLSREKERMRRVNPPEDISGELKVSIIRRLLELGADPNKRDGQGSLPLVATMVIVDPTHRFGSIQSPHTPQLMSILLDAGAEIDAQDGQGSTALRAHVTRGFLDDAKMLLERGADVNFRDEFENTLLHFDHDIDMVKLLLQYGADPNAKNIEGITPLHEAVNTAALIGDPASLEIIKLLVGHGADPDQDADPDRPDFPDGLTARQMAKEYAEEGRYSVLKKILLFFNSIDNKGRNT